MNLHVDQIMEFLDKATDVVKSAAPLATMMGVPFVEKIAGWADTAVDVGKNALTRAEEGKIVMTSNDKDLIHDRITQLEQENDKLSNIIDAS